MTADESYGSGGLDELITTYRQGNAFDNILEMANLNNSAGDNIKILTVLKELIEGGNLAQETVAEHLATNLLTGEELDSDVLELAESIVGKKAAKKASNSSRLREPWNPEMQEVWKKVEMELRLLEIRTQRVLAIKREKVEKEELIKELRIIMPALYRTRDPTCRTCERFATILSHPSMDEDTKLEVLGPFPIFIKYLAEQQAALSAKIDAGNPLAEGQKETPEQQMKDVLTVRDKLFSIATNVIEHGEDVRATNKLQYAAMQVLGDMIEAVKSYHKQRGGIPLEEQLPQDKKAFHKPEGESGIKNKIKRDGLRLTIGDKTIVTKSKP